MRLKILGIIATVALVAGCETAPTTKDAASGSGKSGLTEAYSSQKPSMRKGSQQDLVVNVGDRVFFDYDQYNLQSESRKVLEKQAAWLKENGAVKVVIEGHADERGTREYNLALGERRANSVKDYLVALGVADNRIDTISFGKERSVAQGSNEAAWAQNRRSVTVTK
jgi:peptidoglycan-associated lipoprotein